MCYKSGSESGLWWAIYQKLFQRSCVGYCDLAVKKNSGYIEEKLSALREFKRTVVSSLVRFWFYLLLSLDNL
jgi:hypothetical protein